MLIELVENLNAPYFKEQEAFFNELANDVMP